MLYLQTVGCAGEKNDIKKHDVMKTLCTSLAHLGTSRFLHSGLKVKLSNEQQINYNGFFSSEHPVLRTLDLGIRLNEFSELGICDCSGYSFQGKLALFIYLFIYYLSHTTFICGNR